MRITWFGSSSFRLYVGGTIIVTDPHRAPAGVDRAELTAAADHVITLSGGQDELPTFDPAVFRRARRHTPLEHDAPGPLQLFSLSGQGLFIHEPEEGPVLLAEARYASWGRFADNAVVVLFGQAPDLPSPATALLASARPKLLALAAAELSDEMFRAIGETCSSGDCALQVLEPGLSLEV